MEEERQPRSQRRQHRRGEQQAEDEHAAEPRIEHIGERRQEGCDHQAPVPALRVWKN